MAEFETIKRGRNAAIFLAIVVVWVGLDMATKAYFNSFAPGTVVSGSILGLIEFSVAHNTGGAWGMFDQSTIALGVLSLIVCAGITIYLFTAGKRASVLEVTGAALIVAGGIGNAINRFTLGYVVDFIHAIFIDFPTFNIADIGVTCGFVLFFAGLLFSSRSEPENPPEPPMPPEPPTPPAPPMPPTPPAGPYDSGNYNPWGY